MRLYTFTNYYLSSIQQGIQPLHVVGELFVKYEDRESATQQRHVLYKWAREHKTVICLNGGAAADIVEIYNALALRIAPVLRLPFADFHEDEYSLSGIRTSVGIVIPKHIYDPVFDANQQPGLTSEELELYNMIKSLPLAK